MEVLRSGRVGQRVEIAPLRRDDETVFTDGAGLDTKTQPLQGGLQLAAAAGGARIDPDRDGRPRGQERHDTREQALEAVSGIASRDQRSVVLPARSAGDGRRCRALKTAVEQAEI